MMRRMTIDELPDRRKSALNAEALRVARSILDDVHARGEKAVREHALRLGDLDAPDAPLIHDSDALREAARSIGDEQLGVLERTAERIRGFASAQLRGMTAGSIATPGGDSGWDVKPAAAAGCYAPGGRFPLPSSVLMTAVTARVAGVERVIVASPRPTPTTSAAAAIAGADALVAVGGVQGIAAMAMGIGGVPACDVIVGPGNAYVTAAKYLLSDRVRIDMLAGPSELLIIADDDANPAIVAADLLAQAEHDVDAIPMLIAMSESFVNAVEASMRSQLATLSTATTARTAIERNGFTLRAQTAGEAAQWADVIAPEHLQLSVSDAEEFAGQLKNYGALFIGESTAEVYGDYGFGPNHVLPTGGTARLTSGLSVMSFLRMPTWLQVEKSQEASDAIDDAVALARMEGLEAHARAAEMRLER